MREIERNTFHQKGKDSRTFGSMVRFPSLMNRSIFRTKGLSPDGKVNNKTVDDSIERKTLKIDEVNRKEYVSRNVPSMERNSVDCDEKVTLKTGLLLDQESEEKCLRNENMGLKECVKEEALEGKTVKELQEQIRNMKRTFLFEQNHLMEGCELEKFELRESYEEEKTRLKKAFENEKTELLKEIERKDKMSSLLNQHFK